MYGSPGYGKPTHQYGQPFGDGIFEGVADGAAAGGAALESEREGGTLTAEALEAAMDQAWAGTGFEKPCQES